MGDDFMSIINTLICIISSINVKTYDDHFINDPLYEDILFNLNMIDLLWSRISYDIGLTRVQYLKKYRYIHYTLSDCLDVTHMILLWLNKTITAIEDQHNHNLCNTIRFRPKWKI